MKTRTALVVVVGAGLFILATYFALPVLFVVVLLSGPPGLGACLVGLWTLCCFLGRWILLKLKPGAAPSNAAALIASATGAALLLAGIAAATGPVGNPHAELAYAAKMRLSDVRVVEGGAGCPHRCIAGEVQNDGHQTVFGVSFSFDCRDDAGHPLGNVSTDVPLIPAVPMAPGGRASFLYYPTTGYAGVDPRFTQVVARVVAAKLETRGALRRFVQMILGRIAAPPRVSDREKGVWYMPEENMEYTLKMRVTARLEKAADGGYVAIGELENGGDLPIRAVSVFCRAFDAQGRIAGIGSAQVARYDSRRLDGPFEPMPSHTRRPFSAALTLNAWSPPDHGAPVTLETSVQDLNLGRKN